ncbi:TraR/DksA C4-type zinc finger protein [Paenibacillus lemnae]|uniref:Conjugal transfer protein TraR n=1 Tax=Paenibacillus lemnae TaxID=1330551 RepID=A0A848M9W7_PAELE|nr:TraR/DksA C4-type zinc finger protein [Paenibacillus lemnae]NMO96284.1 conjugal transfer protein TraR [Paenibacillus lemnae]
MSQLSDKQIQTLKERLNEEQERLSLHFEQNEDENLLSDSLSDSTGELSAADNHPGDVGTETFERGRDLAINENLSSEQDEINQAFKRIDEGTYGTCLECGNDIPFERLEALPFTAYCIEHTPDQHLSNDRPAEEDVITPPPGGAGVNRQHSEGRFDDAGAWDDVENYGTATSPAMNIEPGEDDYKNEG